MRKVSGVDEAAARESPVPSGTTLLWLMTHMAHAERLWIVHRFAGGTKPSTAATVDDTVESAIAQYIDTWAVTDPVIAAARDLDQLSCIADDNGPVTLRWILAHLLEETARHAGHADILRELVDGVTGR